MVVDHQDEEHEPDLLERDYLNSADQVGHEKWSQISIKQGREHSDMGAHLATLVWNLCLLNRQSHCLETNHCRS